MNVLARSVLAGFVIVGSYCGSTFAASVTKVPLWGGDVQVLEVSPSNPDVVYVGSAYNGSYVSKDAGATWVSIKFSSTTVSQGVTSICIDSSDPSKVLMANRDVMRSTDYGATWENTTSALNLDVEKVVASKTTSNKFYLLGREDSGKIAVVYTSTDGGVTWVNRRVVDTGCSARYIAVDNNDNIYVTIMDDEDFYGPLYSGTLFRSTDTVTFQSIRPFNFSPDLLQISSNTLMVNVESNSNTAAYNCVISTNLGETFVATTTVTSSKTHRFLSIDGQKMYYYDWGSTRPIMVSSAPYFNSSVVFSSPTPISYTQIGARPGAVVSTPNPAIFYLTNSEQGVMKSIDGGATWSAANMGMGGVMALDGCKDSDGNMYIIGNLTLYKGTGIGTASEAWTKKYCGR
jgi:hypothetical protein